MTPNLILIAAALASGGEGGPTAAEVEKAALEAALTAFLDAHDEDLRRAELEDGGAVLLWSDFPKSTTRDASRRCGEILERLTTALGPVAGEEEKPVAMNVVMLRDTETYHALCESLAAAAPRLKPFLLGSRDTTGFTLYAPELTVYFHDPLVQQEARPDHSVAHSLVHLELHRRYGVLPLWLAEGLATAGEDGAWGEVWAPWHLDGFVWADSHGEWRGKRTRAAVQETEGELAALFTYSAKPYRDVEARLAFAFATYGLDRDPVGLQRFLDLLVEARPPADALGTRWKPSAEQAAAMVGEAFGADFGRDFTKWWKRPPSWKKKPKPVRTPE